MRNPCFSSSCRTGLPVALRFLLSKGYNRVQGQILLSKGYYRIKKYDSTFSVVNARFEIMNADFLASLSAIYYNGFYRRIQKNRAALRSFYDYAIEIRAFHTIMKVIPLSSAYRIVYEEERNENIKRIKSW